MVQDMPNILAGAPQNVAQNAFLHSIMDNTGLGAALLNKLTELQRVNRLKSFYWLPQVFCWRSCVSCFSFCRMIVPQLMSDDRARTGSLLALANGPIKERAFCLP